MADTGDQAWKEAVHRPDDLLRGTDATSFAARLDRWVAEARVDEAALQRARERWLRDVAEQEATFSGVLTELAERRAGVTVGMHGRRHHGVIVAIGVDFVALRGSTGGDVLLALHEIGMVRITGSASDVVGDRMVSTELRLSDVLAELAVDRDRVRLVTSAGDVVSGSLRSVGQDVIVVRTDGERPGTAYVPRTAVVEVSIG